MPCNFVLSCIGIFLHVYVYSILWVDCDYVFVLRISCEFSILVLGCSGQLTPIAYDIWLQCDGVLCRVHTNCIYMHCTCNNIFIDYYIILGVLMTCLIWLGIVQKAVFCVFGCVTLVFIFNECNCAPSGKKQWLECRW